MFTTFPSTPRGRSRFSKALPVAPAENEEFPAKMATSAQSPLPPLPKDAMVPPKAIPRRPVGGQNESAKAPSIQSFSSEYSDGLSRTLSDSSSRDTKYSLSTVDSEGDSLPSAPSKVKENQSHEGVVTNILDSPQSPNVSPQRPEIWKRRSIRSEKNIVLPQLRLQKSNGSTASPPRRQEQNTERPQLPRSITGRKPVPVRPAPPQPDLMGNKLAKLEGRLENKLKKKGSSEVTSSKNEAPTQQYPPPQRLPTAEYLKADTRQPGTPQVLSPISPFTPPEETAPTLPPKAEVRNKSTSKSTTMSETEIPNLLSNHTREPSEALTITSEPQVMRSPQPQKAFPARLLSSQPSPDKKPPLNLGSPTVHSSYFPMWSPAEQGTVFPGLALDVVHYDCYQAHKFMRGSRNALCPVACMICQRKDAEMRWRCTWCCLSACGSCMQVLSSTPGKDLRVAMERIEAGK